MPGTIVLGERVMEKGDAVWFTSKTGKRRKATLTRSTPGPEGWIEVILEGDPFPVAVHPSRCSCGTLPDGVSSASDSGTAGTSTQRRAMATATKTPAERRAEIRDLKTKAQSLGVKKVDDMSRAELQDAITAAEKPAAPATKAVARKAPAKKVAAKAASKPVAKKAASKPTPPAKPAAKATKAPAKKAPAKKAPASKAVAKAGAEPDPTGNPFRAGTDRHVIFKILIKGGTRRHIAEALQKKITLNPYSDDHGELTIYDFDKRATLTAQALRDNHGFEYLKEGRGLDAVITMTPPKPRAAKKAAAKK